MTLHISGDCKGRWQRIWFGSPVKVGHQPRVFSPPIESTDFPINQIRIHFNQRHLTYYTEIDAVALLGNFYQQQKKVFHN
jgi:F-box/leucine-rich repeat protein 4